MAIYYDTPLDRTFHALGDPTRRRMIAALAEKGPRTASELGEPFDISQPSVSKHISVLEKAGLVDRSIEGRTHRFQLNCTPLEEADSWIARHRQFWQGSLAQLDTLITSLERESHD